MITTKQAGTDEKVRVQFQASFGIQSLERKVDVLSPEEWIEFRTAYNNNRYISQYGSKGATIEDDYATRLAMIGGKESYYFLNDPRWTEPGYGNLKLMKKTLTDAQYTKYTTILNMTLKEQRHRSKVGT